MAITRLQQARQLYAVGQLVSKTLDGSRPGYRGEGEYQGGTSSSGGKSGNTGGDRHNPHTDSGYSKSSPPSSKSYEGPGNIHSNDPKAPPAYEVIGGKKYDVTPDTRKERELARMKQTIVKAPLPNVTPKGTEYYDPTTGTLLGFAPTKKNPFSLGNIATNIVLGIVAPQLLGPKFATGMKAYNIAKTASKFAQDIGLTDTNVIGSFTDNLTSNLSDKFSGFGKGKKSRTKTTTSIDEDLSKIGNGDGGLETLGNMDEFNQEYLLLLNKFNSGNFTDSDRVRFTFLKNMLGK
tara:strand:+ start:44 stop:919 length:876 start_codon:yes stop_codon:yes gene_type:complete